MNIHFLKTIWSDIILLEHNGEAAMIDTGFKEQYPEIEQYLHHLGIQKLSFILLTHFHRDHYGSIQDIIENFSVDCVYMKTYSGLDCTTAWGTEADDAYRMSEKTKYEALIQAIEKRSKCIFVESVNQIPFGPTKLELYATDNSIQKIYEDQTHPDTYHKFTCSENQNSLCVYMNIYGKNVYFGGDMMDTGSAHPLGAYATLQVAKQLRCEMDLYKVPHHGTIHTGCEETLSIYRPKIAVITNEDAYLAEHSDVYANLKKANPKVQIILTEKENFVFNCEQWKESQKD